MRGPAAPLAPGIKPRALEEQLAPSAVLLKGHSAFGSKFPEGVSMDTEVLGSRAGVEPFVARVAGGRQACDDGVGDSLDHVVQQCVESADTRKCICLLIGPTGEGLPGHGARSTPMRPWVDRR